MPSSGFIVVPVDKRMAKSNQLITKARIGVPDSKEPMLYQLESGLQNITTFYIKLVLNYF